MSIITSIVDMLPWAASTPVSREEKEKEKEKRSLGAFSVLDIKIRSQIWHYATLGFPIPIHDVDWTPAPEPMDPPSLLDNIKDSFQSLAILHSQPHIQFPILLASHMIKDEAIDELYDHNYSITFTMSPTMDPGCLYSDLQNPAFIGDIHSPHSQKCRLDYSDIQKTDFARFARVTFIIRGPDAKKRDWSTSKPEAIDSIIRKAIVPSKLQRLQRSLKELVVSFENQEGWVWTRKENLRQFNNDFKQMCYGLDGYTTQLTEENARGTLEQCLSIFRGLDEVKKLVVELPPTIGLDDRLFKFITKGFREDGRGHDHVVVKNADGKEYVFAYKDDELQRPKGAPTTLEVGGKEQWKVYEVQGPTGHELGGG